MAYMNSRPLTLRVAALFGAALLAVNVSAQIPLKHSDKTFIEKATKSGREEVDISRIALERTSNADVKSFAKMLVAEHGAANETLAVIATNKAVSLPAKDLESSEKWLKKSGKNFDEDYLEKMISAHKDAVQLFEEQANEGQDTETKAFARATLPKLQHHLQKAMDLKKTLR